MATARAHRLAIGLAWLGVAACGGPVPPRTPPPPPDDVGHLRGDTAGDGVRRRQAAPAAWTWSRDQVTCQQLWPVGYRCDGGAVAWRGCGPPLREVDYVAGGKRHHVGEVCVRCAGPPDAPPDYNPLEAGCVADPGDPNPHHNPFNGFLVIDGITWQPDGQGGWTITPPRPPDAPMGADMIPYRCGPDVVPGSVDPAMCGF